MDPKKLTIEYSADFGRFRNQRGMRLSEEQLCDAHPLPRNQKRHYRGRVDDIDKFSILNRGDSYLPQVDDLNMNVSDIVGAQTDSLMSEAIRNRLVARSIREKRMRTELESKEREGQRVKVREREIQKEREGRDVSILSLPRKSYHKAPVYSSDTIKNQEKDIDNYRSSSTLPDELNHRDPQRFRTLNPETISLKPKTNYRQTTSPTKPDPPQCSQQLNDLEDKLLLPTQVKPIFNREPTKSPKQFFQPPSPQRMARINPTFLSFGSEYLYNNNNYLASYGKSLLY